MPGSRVTSFYIWLTAEQFQYNYMNREITACIQCITAGLQSTQVSIAHFRCWPLRVCGGTRTSVDNNITGTWRQHEHWNLFTIWCLQGLAVPPEGKHLACTEHEREEREGGREGKGRRRGRGEDDREGGEEGRGRGRGRRGKGEEGRGRGRGQRGGRQRKGERERRGRRKGRGREGMEERSGKEEDDMWGRKMTWGGVDVGERWEIGENPHRVPPSYTSANCG